MHATVREPKPKLAGFQGRERTGVDAWDFARAYDPMTLRVFPSAFGFAEETRCSQFRRGIRLEFFDLPFPQDVLGLGCCRGTNITEENLVAQ